MDSGIIQFLLLRNRLLPDWDCLAGSGLENNPLRPGRLQESEVDRWNIDKLFPPKTLGLFSLAVCSRSALTLLSFAVVCLSPFDTGASFPVEAAFCQVEVTGIHLSDRKTTR